MALNRFTNVDDIISTNGPLLTSTWRPEHVSILAPSATSLTPGPVGYGLPYLQNTDIVVETHVYGPTANQLVPTDT